MRLFEIEQELLPPQPAAVAAELAVLVDDAVARNHDGDAIEAVGAADGALSAGRADASGHVFVGAGVAIGNVAQLIPDAAFKWTTRIDQWHREPFERAGEIGREFVVQTPQMTILTGYQCTAEALAERLELRWEHAPLGEFQQTNALVRGAGDQRPHRAFEPGQEDAIGLRALSGRLAESFGEGVAKAAVRFVAVAEDHVVEL